MNEVFKPKINKLSKQYSKVLPRKVLPRKALPRKAELTMPVSLQICNVKLEERLYK